MIELQEGAILAAEEFVTRRGMEVPGTEWKSEGDGSIDLIAFDEDDTVVFIDANARRGLDKGLPSGTSRTPESSWRSTEPSTGRP